MYMVRAAEFLVNYHKRRKDKVLLFSDALKNSSNSAGWKEHEMGIAKAIEAIAPIFSKFEEQIDKGKDYKPSVYELGSVFQDYKNS